MAMSGLGCQMFPCERWWAIRAFIEYYNFRCYHEGLSNVTFYDVYSRRYVKLIRRRKDAKSRTLQARRDYN